jgi:Histidine kinase-, DNA gyrase B-, and HSP90-like ATPase
MITRDITLEDSILDLIDNSVDGAWRSEGSRPSGLADDTDLSKYSISITASPKKFSIKDNCGGMSLDDAAEHAFSFGRQETDKQHDYSIGVYGIGMKRACFKLGTDIKIRSTYEDHDKSRQSFAVPIDVSKWIRNNDLPWDFDIIEDQPLDENGVEVVVNTLTSGAADSLGNPAFIENLRRTIARDYTLHLHRGLKITVNEREISGWQIELRESEEFAPMRDKYRDEVDGKEVNVEIIGGMAAPPPESNDPDESEGGRNPYGWFVVCNGRIVLAADKTSVSGWGTDDWPQWHYQYSGFIGIILFTAANAVALPLTTTKRSVDPSSEIFRRARLRMREVSKQWIAYTNEKKQAREEAKQKESAAKPVPIHDIKKREKAALPALVSQTREPPANVSYSVPRSKLRNLAREFGSIHMSYRDVGLKSFNYAYDDMVGDE